MADPFLGATSTQWGAGLGAAGAIAGGIGGYFADEASAEGYKQESQAYTQAAGYAQSNVDLAEEAKTIKMYQTQRQIDSTIGAQRVAVGASGFAESGSALDILRSSMSEGALAEGLVGVQGEINAEGYRAQKAQDLGLAKQSAAAADAASTRGITDIIGGVFKAGTALLPLL